MSLSDREKIELREVVDSVVTPHMETLRKELAGMCVQILECFAEDLAKIIEASNAEAFAKWKELNEKRSAKKAGFR